MSRIVHRSSHKRIPTIGLLLALLNMVSVTVRAWRNRAWSEAVRILYPLVAAGAMGFVPFLAYWNLLGTRL